jgi:hypothetical protein
LTVGMSFVSLTAWLIFRRPASLFAGLLAGSALFAARRETLARAYREITGNEITEVLSMLRD